MNRSLKQTLAARLAVVLVIAGGAIAAVAATGQGPTYTPAAARHGTHRIARHNLAGAASYLGVTVAQLQRDLGPGTTLAELANATGGRSAAGLIRALVAEKRLKLSAAAASLSRRVTAAVNRRGGPGAAAGAARATGSPRRPGWHRLFVTPRRLGFVAASYLGMPGAELQSDLRSGMTMADVARAKGVSEAGLIDALVAARRARLAAAVASGRITAAKASLIGSKLSRRMTRLVNASQVKAGRSGGGRAASGR